MDNQRDAIAAIFGASVDLAGLLLVFMGFVFAKAESFDSVRHADRYRRMARIGLIPFGVCLICAWCSFDFLHGNGISATAIVVMFRLGIVTMGVYAFVAVFGYL